MTDFIEPGMPSNVPPSLAVFIQAFLAVRALDEPDGRPLYAYRCTETELDQFQSLLRDGLASQPARLRTSTQQALCLWASEQFRRSYRGGAWNWSDVLARIDATYLAPESFGYPLLCEAVAKGLLAWRRELIRSPHARLFLITLVCEGGLPLYLVQREQAKLRTFFRALFEEVRTHQITGTLGTRVSVQELARRVGHVLPATLRQEVVFELSGQLIGKIWEFMSLVRDAVNPVEALDKHHAGWRQELPLELEDELTRSFLNGLVKEARAITHGARASVQWIRTITVSSASEDAIEDEEEEGGQRFELSAHLEVPPMLSNEQFGALFGEPAPSRFELCVVDDAGEIVTVAIGSAREADESIRLDPYTRALRPVSGRRAVEGRALSVRSAKGRMGPSLAYRGALTLSPLPWVFRAMESSSTGRLRYQLAGEGSYRTREPEVLIAAPDGWSMHPEPEAICEQVGSIRGLEQLRRVFRLSGEAIIEGAADARCLINTGDQGAPTAPDYRLSGRLLEIGQRNTPVFIGSPTVICAAATGVSTSVARRELQWRAARTGARWHPMTGNQYGDGYLRHVVDGRVQFTAAARVVPQAFAIGFRPLSNTEGVIELRGGEGVSAGVHPIDGIDSFPDSSVRGIVAIRLKAERHVPANVRVHLDWATSGDLDLDLPFPADQIVFVTLTGQRLASNSCVAVSQLAGIRALALVPNHRRQFHVEITLISGQRNLYGTQRAFSWHAMAQDQPGMHSLNLGTLQQGILEQLNSNADLDCAVRLVIASNDLTGTPSPSLLVHRYDLVLEPGVDGATLRIPGTALLEKPAAQIETLRVEALSLLEPNAEPIPLEEVGIAEWSVQNSSITTGPWMVLGWSGHWCRVRPRLIDASGHAAEGADHSAKQLVEARGLAAACSMSGMAARKKALAEEIHRLTSDPDDADWQLLLGHVRLTEHLPAASLDTVCALGEDLEAAALAALVAIEADQELFAQVWTALRSLPFSWLAIPRPVWHAALTRWLLARRRILESVQLPGVDPIQMVNEHTYELVRRALTANERMPWLAPVLEYARLAALDIDCSIDTKAISRPHMREIALAQYWDAISRIPAAPVGVPDPVPRTHEMFRNEHVLLVPAFERLRVDPSRQRGVVGAARGAYLNAPAIAAVCAATGRQLEISARVELRNAHDYDPRVFESAYYWAYIYALGSQS